MPSSPRDVPPGPVRPAPLSPTERTGELDAADLAESVRQLAALNNPATCADHPGDHPTIMQAVIAEPGVSGAFAQIGPHQDGARVDQNSAGDHPEQRALRAGGIRAPATLCDERQGRQSVRRRQHGPRGVRPLGTLPARHLGSWRL
jgi:hypothetical protein